MSTLFSRNLLALAVLSASVPTMAQEHSLNELVIIAMMHPHPPCPAPPM